MLSPLYLGSVLHSSGDLMIFILDLLKQYSVFFMFLQEDKFLGENSLVGDPPSMFR